MFMIMRLSDALHLKAILTDVLLPAGAIRHQSAKTTQGVSINVRVFHHMFTTNQKIEYMQHLQRMFIQIQGNPASNMRLVLNSVCVLSTLEH